MITNSDTFLGISHNLNTKDVFDIVYSRVKIAFEQNDLQAAKDSNEFLSQYIKENVVYGVNTGFGPMAQYVLSNKERMQLQLNLIRSHSSGSGKVIEPIFIRATLLARLQTLKLGYSGVSIQTIELLKEFINHEIYPLIYEHGGVGASGDLVQLSHVALSLIGEGEVYYKGSVMPTSQAMTLCNIAPLKITFREGLALINGTSTMNGIGYVNLFYAKNLVQWSVKLSALLYEILEVYDDFFSETLNRCKKHEGQHIIAGKLREQLSGSKRIRKREKKNYKFRAKTNELEMKMQEYYSIRCTPQILGPIYDTVCTSEKVLNNEINSVNDNPIIDAKNKQVLHGGNFHGDYISLEMDKLKLSIIKLSILTERQINYIFNNTLNKTLPPFLNRGVLGLNLGLQGTQFPATSTVSENMTLGSSNYINNISTNNDNQDVVSMGTNAAQITNKVIMNSYEVMAIEYQALMSAIDYLDIEKDLSAENQKLFQESKQVMTFHNCADVPSYQQLKTIKTYLEQLENIYD